MTSPRADTPDRREGGRMKIGYSGFDKSGVKPTRSGI